MAVRVSEPGEQWRNGARQVRGFFDSFLESNPSWKNGLTQLQRANPSWARGAEQLGSFFTGTPERSIPGREPQGGGMGGGRNFPRSWDASNTFSNKTDPMQKYRDEFRAKQTGEDEYQPLSLAEALARAMGLIGGEDGGYEKVNFDPQRNALRSRAADSDARLAAMYKQLQGSYAADAPVLNAAYDTAVSSTNEATDQGVENINAAYDKARADQSAQLAALGIEDAAAVIAGAGQSSGSDQAGAVANLEQNRGANVNQLNTGKRAAGTYNTQIGQAAGLEGNLQRAANQSKLQQLLADIDAQEQGANAQLANQSRGSNQGNIMQLAQALVEEDRYGQEYADKRADVDFDKQQQAAALAAKLQGDTADRFDPQQAVTATNDYFTSQGIEPDADTWNKVFGNMIRNFSVGY